MRPLPDTGRLVGYGVVDHHPSSLCLASSLPSRAQLPDPIRDLAPFGDRGGTVANDLLLPKLPSRFHRSSHQLAILARCLNTC
jgi:hypothetical protein